MSRMSRNVVHGIFLNINQCLVISRVSQSKQLTRKLKTEKVALKNCFSDIPNHRICQIAKADCFIFVCDFKNFK